MKLRPTWSDALAKPSGYFGVADAKSSAADWTAPAAKITVFAVSTSPDASSTPLICPPAQACHLRRDAGLVNEHQLVGIEVELAIKPETSGDQHVFALLLGRVRGLFLNVMARFLKKCQTVEGAADIPCSFASRSAIS